MMMTRRIAGAVLAAVLAGALLPAAAGAAGSTPVPATPRPPDAPRRTPAEEAKDHYNAGLAMLERARKHAARAAAASSDAKRDKQRLRARRQYERAIEELALATRKDARFHQAYSSLGYALRKTGDYTASLAAYDRALALAPDYSEAIEYRAEAHLGLGRVEEAKQAYIRLFTADRARADLLLVAMRAWVDERAAAPGVADPGTVEALRTWVEQREEIARDTPGVSQPDRGGW